MKLRLHVGAARDIEQAADYFGSVSLRLRAGLGVELDKALERIATYPHTGTPLAGSSKIRRMTIKRFPYSIIYTTIEPEIVVLAFAHHSRRPDYWSDRAK